MGKEKPTQAVLAFPPDELSAIMNNYDSVRLCPKLGLQTTIELHQNKKHAESLLKVYSESADAIKEKHTSSDGKLDKANYEKDLTELNKRPIETKFKIVSKSKFPKEREEFGYKDIERQSASGQVMKNRVHFVDAFVELYTAGLILDDTTVISEE